MSTLFSLVIIVILAVLIIEDLIPVWAVARVRRKPK